MKKTLLRNLTILFSAVVFGFALPSTEAFAEDDFFTSESGESHLDDDSSDSDTKSGFLGNLGSSIQKSTGSSKKDDTGKRGRWSKFEDVRGTEALKKFLNSPEIQIKRELHKPLPKTQPFGNRLDEIEDSINSLKTPAELQQENQ